MAREITGERPPSPPDSTGPGVRLYALLLAMILALGAVWRVYLFYSGRLLFDSDQAVFGLAGIHLLAGGRPYIMLPGQNYGGYYPSYYFMALHWLFPPSVALIRLGMIPLACALGWAAAWASSSLFQSRIAALIAAAAVMFAPAGALDMLFRPSVLTIIPILGVLASMVLVAVVLEQLEISGRPGRQAYLAMFFVGALLGFGFWGTPATLVYMLSLALAVVLTAGAFGNVTGLRDWRAGCGAGVSRAVGSIAILVFLSCLALVSHWLLNGNGMLRQGRVGFARAALIAAAAASALQAIGWMIIPRRYGMRTPGALWLVPASFAGLWLGAAPAIWFQWIGGTPTKEFSRWVTEGRQAIVQLLSVFHSGIPILTGYYNTWMRVPAGTPWLLRALGMTIYAGALAVIMLAAFRVHPSRPLRMRFGLQAVFWLSVVQIIIFSAAFDGWFVQDARYLLILFVTMALSVGVCAGWLWERGGIGRGLAVGGTALIIAVGVASGLSMHRTPVIMWTGEDRGERRLVDELLARGITRVSNRFDPDGFWFSYNLTYISGQRVVIVPGGNATMSDIRSPELQALVNEAPGLAYLVRDGNQQLVEAYLSAQGAKWQSAAVSGYHVFHGVQPDVLRQFANRAELEASAPPADKAAKTVDP